MLFNITYTSYKTIIFQDHLVILKIHSTVNIGGLKVSHRINDLVESKGEHMRNKVEAYIDWIIILQRCNERKSGLNYFNAQGGI